MFAFAFSVQCPPPPPQYFALFHHINLRLHVYNLNYNLFCHASIYLSGSQCIAVTFGMTLGIKFVFKSLFDLDIVDIC